MSKVALSGDAGGTGTITLAAPNTNSNVTLNLPVTAGTMATAESTLTQFNVTGSAPVYACRAWVNFNGTGTVAIRASGNVSSITDNGTSDYTVNFTTAMSDANYAVTGIGYHLVNVTEGPLVAYQGSQASGSVRIQYRGNGGNPDPETVQVAIFR
jgi:hypothetical protein